MSKASVKSVPEGINEAAVLHFAAGVFEAQEVPVGHHDLSGLKIVIKCPDGAAVDRGPGSTGEGYDECASKGASISPIALLLFLERSGAMAHANAEALWVECIREGLERGGKLDENLMPVEAIKALEQVQATLQGDCKSRRKTPAKRVGMDWVEVSVQGKKTRKPVA